MSFLEYRVKFVPTGLRKVLHLNWPLVVLVAAAYANTFGVLVQGFYQERELRREAQEIPGGFFQIDPNGTVAKSNPDLAGVYAPGLLGSTLFEQTRERKGGLLSLQFKPADNLTLGVEGFSSKMDANNYNRNFMLWGGNFANTESPKPGYVVKDGVLTNATDQINTNPLLGPYVAPRRDRFAGAWRRSTAYQRHGTGRMVRLTGGALRPSGHPCRAGRCAGRCRGRCSSRPWPRSACPWECRIPRPWPSCPAWGRVGQANTGPPILAGAAAGTARGPRNGASENSRCFGVVSCRCGKALVPAEVWPPSAGRRPPERHHVGGPDASIDSAAVGFYPRSPSVPQESRAAERSLHRPVCIFGRPTGRGGVACLKVIICVTRSAVGRERIRTA